MTSLVRFTRLAAYGMALGSVLPVAQACAGEGGEKAPSSQSAENNAEGSGGAGTAGAEGGGAGENGECYGGFPCPEGETCVFGRCLVAKECNRSRLTCADPEPTCPSGQTAAVVDGCWAGCVPIDTCGYLDDCGICERDGQLCVQRASEVEALYGCHPRPASCGEILTCECVGDDACGPLLCIGIEGELITCVGNTD
jgi:hypothetical protein